MTRVRVDAPRLRSAFLGMEISGLAKMGVQEGGVPERLSEAQERQLVSAVHALNHWSLDEIVETYALLQIDFFRSRFDEAGELMLFVSGML